MPMKPDAKSRCTNQCSDLLISTDPWGFMSAAIHFDYHSIAAKLVTSPHSDSSAPDFSSARALILK